MGRFFQEIANLTIFVKQGFNRMAQFHVAATSAFQVRGAFLLRQLESFGEHRYFVIIGIIHLNPENYHFAAPANPSE